MTEYSRTTPDRKKERISDINETLLAESESSFRYKSHIDNITEVFAIVHETFTGIYIELDFSKKLFW